MGLYDLWPCAGLFCFRKATTLARRQVFGSLDLRKHDVKNECSQTVVFTLWRMTNPRWMLLPPGALPDLHFLMTVSSYSTVKSDVRLPSAVAALESEVTLKYAVYVASASSACGFGKPGVIIAVSAVNNSHLSFRKLHLLKRPCIEFDVVRVDSAIVVCIHSAII